MPLQIRRGTDAERGAMTQPLAAGELIYITDTKRLFVGDGTTVGGIGAIPFVDYTNENAQDAAASLFTTGTHTGISFVYDDATNKINASVVGFTDEQAADAAASLFTTGTHTGISFVYDDATNKINAVVGGTINGDLTGSVFADNSTLLVDGVNGTVSADAVTGQANNLTGAVIRTNIADNTFPLQILGTRNNQIGMQIIVGRRRGINSPLVAGDDVGSIIFTDSAKAVPTAEIQSSVDPLGTPGSITAPGKLSFFVYNNAGARAERLSIDSAGMVRHYGIGLGTSTAPNGISFYGLNNTSISSEGARLLLRRSRGTYEIPTSLVNTDAMYRITFGGHDGTSYVDNTYITARVDGAVSTGIVPSSLDIKTTNAIGTVQTNMSFQSSGATAANGPVKFVSYTDTQRNALVAAIGMVIFNTTDAKLQVCTVGSPTPTWVPLH